MKKQQREAQRVFKRQKNSLFSKAQPVSAPDTRRKWKTNWSVRTRHTTDTLAPLLELLSRALCSVACLRYYVHYSGLALHIPGNRVDPTRGARPFPRSSPAFHYRKERAWVPG